MGSSPGLSGSVAIFTTAFPPSRNGLNTYMSSSVNSLTIVAVLKIVSSTPSSSTQPPAEARSRGTRYLA